LVFLVAYKDLLVEEEEFVSNLSANVKKSDIQQVEETNLLRGSLLRLRGSLLRLRGSLLRLRGSLLLGCLLAVEEQRGQLNTSCEVREGNINFYSPSSWA
jgi:hypothetical protein